MLDKDGHLVAKTTIDRHTKKVTITYEPYVETHSDVTGTLYFYVRMDHLVVTEEKDET
ncbi:Ig-like domain-containing protein [Streptococcus sp.]|uniref:Ig-like domain-containing protein n=1 Tax=Streptococcus sp. TaxID=1306 RepID=UPI00391B1352